MPQVFKLRLFLFNILFYIVINFLFCISLYLFRMCFFAHTYGISIVIMRLKNLTPLTDHCNFLDSLSCFAYCYKVPRFFKYLNSSSLYLIVTRYLSVSLFILSIVIDKCALHSLLIIPVWILAFSCFICHYVYVCSLGGSYLACNSPTSVSRVSIFSIGVHQCPFSAAYCRGRFEALGNSRIGEVFFRVSKCNFILKLIKMIYNPFENG